MQTVHLVVVYIALQAPLGVLLCNENKLDEMGTILTEYMKLVPSVEATLKLNLPIGGEISLDDTHFHNILFGGDQLTVTRIRGTQNMRSTEYRRVDRFEGITPVVEDRCDRTFPVKINFKTLLTQHH